LKKYELLAPAGSIDAFFAAVHSGADAVYLGAYGFNARLSAENFTQEQLISVIRYAHHHKVLIYITLNTLVKNKEWPELIQMVNALCEMGADALIVQDLGLLYILRTYFPDILIHSSTQMTINNTLGVAYLSNLGVNKVVVARENTIDEIRKMTKYGTNIEVFVHGALCICYSGQCLMSGMIGGRSGNRGRCAQPCRMTYQLMDETGQIHKQEVGEHLLSPRDLNALELMPELVEAGVQSFKIEGRMKRPEYVATVVQAYRKKLNQVLFNQEFENLEEMQRDMKQIFNREFTVGYFKGNQGQNMMSYQRPNNRGIALGRILARTPKGFSIQLKEDVMVGDGLEIWITKGGRKGFEVTQLFEEGNNAGEAFKGQTIEIAYDGRVFPGDRVFKTSDISLNQRAQDTYARKTLELSEFVDIWIQGRLDEPLAITMKTQSGLTVTGYSVARLQRAKEKSLDSALLRQKMRLGSSRYVLRDWNVDMEEGLMLPISQVNAVRRQLVDSLDTLSESTDKRTMPLVWDTIIEIEKQSLVNKPISTMHLVVEVDDERQAMAALESGADWVYIHMVRQRKHDMQPMDILTSQQKKKVYYVLPRIIREESIEVIRKRVQTLKGSMHGFVATSLGAIQLLKEESCPHVWGDYSLNIMNDMALKHLLQDGLAGACLSPELTLQEMKSIQSPIALEAIVHGSMPLMVSEHCVVGSLLGKKSGSFCTKPCYQHEFHLSDRKNYHFKLLMQEDCTMSILNARELCAIQEVFELKSSGFSRIKLLLRERSIEEIRELTATYRRILEHSVSNAELEKLRENIEMHSPYGLTKGHYYREVE